MKCPESEEHLHRLMDGAAPIDAPQWERHLAQCPPCRENAVVARAMLDALQRQRTPAPPPGLSRRIVASIAADRPSPPSQPRIRRYWWAVAAMAACIALLMLTQHLWLPTQTISVRMNTFAARPDPTPTVEGSVEKATTAVASLGGRLADNTKKHVRLLWAIAPKLDVASVDNFTPTSADAEITLEPAAASFRNGTSGVTHGVTVMAQTTRRAFDYFLRDLPSLAPSTVKNN